MRTILFLAALVVPLTAAALYAQSRPAQTAPAGALANLLERERQEVTDLPNETLEQSLDRLGRVAWYYRPPSRGRLGLGGTRGGGGGREVVPLAATDEQASLQMILDNPRVAKVYGQLAELPKDEAAKLVSKELQQSMNTYQGLYKAEIDGAAQQRAANPAAAGAGGVGFRVMITDDPSGAPSLVGTRLKVLALLAFAGNLELTASAPAVRDIAKAALTQRQELYNKNGLTQSERFQVLRAYSIYHRSILLTAAAGTMPVPAAQVENLKNRTTQRLGQKDLWVIPPADGTAPDSVIDALFTPPAAK